MATASVLGACGTGQTTPTNPAASSPASGVMTSTSASTSTGALAMNASATTGTTSDASGVGDPDADTNKGDSGREGGADVAGGSMEAGGADACVSGSPPAFPGAVGFGAPATGGRIGAAYHVTNLSDTGTGSFRDAVSAGPRIVVFDVGGIVQLMSPVSVGSNLTVAGQTAPGGGIAIEGREVSFSNSSNVIVRHVRLRQGTDDPDTGKSVIAADGSTLLILDHVSIEFGQWDNADINSGSNVTVQRSIIADPIGQQFNAHCTSGNLTWYQDIWSSAHNRNPLAAGNTQFINNVIYNFQAGYTAANSSGDFSNDVVGNYFISGPSTTNPGDAFFQMSGQLVYSSNNDLDSNRDGVLNGSALAFPGGATQLSAPWTPLTSSIPAAGPSQAYAYDVAQSGALPRDDVDALVMSDVTSLGATGRLWTSQSQTGLTNGGYGTLDGGTPPVDTDGDGIPDAWETAHGLNPNDSSDALEEFGCSGYTNLEEYVNELADSL